jgi:hypothetical protein
VHLLAVQRDLLLELRLARVGEERCVGEVIGLFEKLDLAGVAAQMKSPLSASRTWG